MSIKGTDAKVLIVDDEGNETLLKGIKEMVLPDMDFSEVEARVAASFDPGKDERTVVVIGGYQPNRVQLARALQQLGLSVVDSVAAIQHFNDVITLEAPREIRMPDMFDEHESVSQPRHRPHGWYQKFDKSNKKRNKRITK